MSTKKKKKKSEVEILEILDDFSARWEAKGKLVKELPWDHPSEIVAEFYRDDVGRASVAVAMINTSHAHVHYATNEVYAVLRGCLTLYQSKIKVKAGTVELKPDDFLAIPLDQGEVYQINPGYAHFVRRGGLDEPPAEVLVVAIPEWRKEDHILIGVNPIG